MQLYFPALDIEGLNLEVDTDGGDEGRVEFVLDETNQQTRFADSGVTDEENLHDGIVILGCGGRVGIPRGGGDFSETGHADVRSLIGIRVEW